MKLLSFILSIVGLVATVYSSFFFIRDYQIVNPAEQAAFLHGNHQLGVAALGVFVMICGALLWLRNQRLKKRRKARFEHVSTTATKTSFTSVSSIGLEFVNTYTVQPIRQQLKHLKL